MNPRLVTTAIDPEKCIGCGACIRVCPSDTISLEAGVARVTGDKSLGCGHCTAVCPENAVSVGALDEQMCRFETFEFNTQWLGFGQFPVADYTQLAASRRSCRNYKKKTIDPAALRDLVKIGAMAPSGTNSQEWTFTCLTDREAVLEYALLLKDFFTSLNKKAGSFLLRKGLSMIGRPELKNYYNEYYDSVKDAITEFETNQTDNLFHGATACILVGSSPDANCPKEDAILAASNILLGAHAMGLGTCLIGFAVSAMEHDKTIQEKTGIPGSESIHAVIALGYPDECYIRVTGRKKPVIRFKNGSSHTL